MMYIYIKIVYNHFIIINIEEETIMNIEQKLKEILDKVGKRSYYKYLLKENK